MPRYQFTTEDTSYNRPEIDDNYVAPEDLEMSEEGYNAVEEQFLYEQLKAMGEDYITQFLASEACQILQERGKFSRNTKVKLSRVDDLERRIELNILQYAKEKNDPDYVRYLETREKGRSFIEKMRKKYINPATKNAKEQQKDYITGGKHLPLTFDR